MKKIILFIILSLSLFLSAYSYADTVTLTNGQTISGTVVEQNENFIRVQLKGTASVRGFLLDKIAKITIDGTTTNYHPLEPNAVLEPADDQTQGENKSTPPQAPAKIKTEILTIKTLEEIKTTDDQGTTQTTTTEQKSIETTTPAAQTVSSQNPTNYFPSLKPNFLTFFSPFAASKTFSSNYSEKLLKTFGVSILLVLIGILLFFYVIILCPVYILAKKLKVPAPFLAWIPGFNFYTLCKLAGRSGWWILFFFIPIVNLIISLVILCDICAACGKSKWLGIAGLIPLGSIILFWFLALTYQTDEIKPVQDKPNDNPVKQNDKATDTGNKMSSMPAASATPSVSPTSADTYTMPKIKPRIPLPEVDAENKPEKEKDQDQPAG
ncbi:MAG: DUF805 domain-containing protein [Candidatus Omnitrophica bacterium]|nr:DUF805 domain-containing protein [Candidatus Omnitrophota bacterium]